MVKNFDFDFYSFAIEAIKAIDDVRSFGTNSKQPDAESRINAFYRLIGLPSITAGSKTAVDPLNTGNVIDGIEDNTTKFNEQIRKLEARENAFKQKIEQSELNLYMDYNESRLNDGVEDNRRRGNLFPMYVNGEIPVFPQSRRVGKAFLSEDDLVVDNVKYRRPLIEGIILLKLKSSGVQNSDLLKDIRNDFSDLPTSNLKVVEANLISLFRTSSNKIIDELSYVIESAGIARKNLSGTPIPTPDFVASQKLNISNSGDGISNKLNKSQLFQKITDDLKNASLAILDFDDTYAKTGKTRNLKDVSLMSNILSVVNNSGSGYGLSNKNKSGNTLVEKNKKERKEQIDKANNDLQKIFKNMELLLGVFGGLSGVDILVIINALLEMDVDTLISLLNKESRQLLADMKGDQKYVQSTKSVEAAIADLEKKVKNIYTELDNNSQQSKHSSKKTKGDQK